MRMKRVLLATTVLINVLAVEPVHAATNEEMMAQLKAMQTQMQQMQQEMNRLQKDLAEAKAAAKSSQKITEEIKAAKARPESDVKISLVPAPKFETADGDYSFKIGGFGQVD